jgi:hypothetical protein
MISKVPKSKKMFQRLPCHIEGRVWWHTLLVISSDKLKDEWHWFRLVSQGCCLYIAFHVIMIWVCRVTVS